LMIIHGNLCLKSQWCIQTTAASFAEDRKQRALTSLGVCRFKFAEMCLYCLQFQR